jgi:hypothetical protein
LRFEVGFDLVFVPCYLLCICTWPGLNFQSDGFGDDMQVDLVFGFHTTFIRFPFFFPFHHCFLAFRSKTVLTFGVGFCLEFVYCLMIYHRSGKIDFLFLDLNVFCAWWSRWVLIYHQCFWIYMHWWKGLSLSILSLRGCLAILFLFIYFCFAVKNNLDDIFEKVMKNNLDVFFYGLYRLIDF